MRIRLAFEDPLPAYKCWYEIPASCSTIRDLQRAVRKGFNLDQYCKTTRLDLDGFFLLPASTIAGSLKDDDLLQVMIRRKGDSLPPRNLPVSGGKKRSSEDAGLSNSDRKSSKKIKSTPHNKKPTVPLVKQDNAQKQQSGQGQQRQQQPSGQKNNEKNRQNNKKAKQNNNSQIQQNSNKSQQNNQQSTSKVSGNAQDKGNKNNKTNAASNTNTSNNAANTNAQNPKGAVKIGTKGLKNSRTAVTDRKQSVNERRKVRFAPGLSSQRKRTTVTESSSDDSSDNDSSDNDSSDNDSSDSSSSDSSDSSKDSSDSSNSDSDSSDSDSNSNKKNETKAVATRIVPGKGMGATKSRNARRRLLKMKLAEAREEADSKSDSSGTNHLKRHPIAVTRLVDATPETPPLQTSGKAAKTASQANGKDSAYDNKKTVSPQANGKATAQASARPKVFMTSVDLKDGELMTKTAPKRVTRSSQKKPNGATQEAPATPQPETVVKQKDSGNNKTVATEKDSDDTSEADVTPRDYNSLLKPEDNLAVGDLIAFKTLEMGPSYEPIISDFKEATVLSSSMTDMTAEVQLARQFRTPVQLDDDGNPILGKFDIYDEEEVERARRGIVSLDILGLADCRIISKK